MFGKVTARKGHSVHIRHKPFSVLVSEGVCSAPPSQDYQQTGTNLTKHEKETTYSIRKIAIPGSGFTARAVIFGCNMVHR